VVLRFSNVYGSERDLPERVIPKFMARALRGEDIVLYGGDQVLDFTFVNDTIDGIVKAYEQVLDGTSILGEDFHLATGRGCSVYELANMIVRLTGSSSKVVKGPAQDFDVHKFYADTGKAKERLGYEAKTPLEEGLKILMERMRPMEAPAPR
jgi:nucleoside-diphosphate-sugar epimerase